ncbi:formate dehydrogenase accessory protein FdhE domain-containing protein [Anaeromyxobacter paludicola]|uniref:Formate dehydrogenase accessory protein FdhE n=1 Tax=Anaeromyxobacter paludicola TaxID=2918171 RepID=A0ABM7X6A0_9BACT|nr:formate dehydrogenase accessory protein FdhE [Anaeromyxobacter paludicola]BDG07337.1 hypothetical protein AMPC_04500 [Anaeromyxobacter paludicola]
MTTVRLPDPGALLARRAARLAELAPEDASGFLAFCARLAAAQAAAAPELPAPAPALPSPGPRPPLDLAAWRDPAAPAASRAVAAALAGRPLPAPAREAARRVAAASDAELAALAERVLAGAPAPGELAAATFVAAGLQVAFARGAAALEASALAGGGAACPACGAPPAGATIEGDGRRLLWCGLCGTGWARARGACARCGAGDLEQLAVAGGGPGLVAEACRACRGYLKLAHLERRPRAEPVAEDLASPLLDALVAAEGWEPLGRSWLLPR